MLLLDRLEEQVILLTYPEQSIKMKIGSVVRLLTDNQGYRCALLREDYGIGMVVGYTKHNSGREWLVLWPKKSFRQWRAAFSLEVISE